MIHEQWAEVPFPIWAANNDAFNAIMDSDSLMSARPVFDIYMRHRGGVAFRGVSLDRLPAILASGVDVEPTDSVIYCDFISKAYEYGGDAKVIMGFRYFGPTEQHLVHRAVTQFPLTTNREAAPERRLLYPYDLGLTQAGHSRMCRVQPKNAAELNYLSTYGYFIPGNPWDALVGLLIYGNRDALDGARPLVHEFANTSASIS